MKKTKTIRFVESLIILPIMTMTSSGSLVGMFLFPQVVVVSQANKIDEVNPALKLEAQAIDAYFAERGMPLEGSGKKMAEEAEKNEIDWRLLPAIAVRESTGGKFDCKKVPNNAFGWGSCKIGFKSNEEAIETVARNLGGKNPNTSYHYDNKSTKEILQAYNPPTIVRRYAEQVIAIMDDIGV